MKLSSNAFILPLRFNETVRCNANPRRWSTLWKLRRLLVWRSTKDPKSVILTEMILDFVFPRYNEVGKHVITISEKTKNIAATPTKSTLQINWSLPCARCACCGLSSIERGAIASGLKFSLRTTVDDPIARTWKFAMKSAPAIPTQVRLTTWKGYLGKRKQEPTVLAWYSASHESAQDEDRDQSMRRSLNCPYLPLERTLI